MKNIYILNVLPDGYGQGVVPGIDTPKYCPTLENYESQDAWDNWNNHLASLPTLLIHPSLQPVPGTFIKPWQEGYEQCVVGSGGDSNGPNMVWVKTIKEIYDDYKPVFPNDYRKVAIPVTENREVDEHEKNQILNPIREEVKDTVEYWEDFASQLFIRAKSRYGGGNQQKDLIAAMLKHYTQPGGSTEANKEAEAGNAWTEYIKQFSKLDEFWNSIPEVTRLWLSQQIDIFAGKYPKNEPRQEGDSLIEDAVNAYFHQTVDRLGEKDLGDIEKKQLENIKKKCEDWFKQHPL